MFWDRSPVLKYRRMRWSRSFSAVLNFKLVVVRVCREAGRLLYRVDRGHWCVTERDAAGLIDRARDKYKLGIKLRDPDVDLRVTDELTEEARDVFSARISSTVWPSTLMRPV